MEFGQRLPSRTSAEGHSLRPLTTVMTWELRRLWSERFVWILAGAAFFSFVFVLWARNRWVVVDTLPIVGTTRFGQLGELTSGLMLIFGLMLPFLAADGVAHDYRQGVHEILMATAIPTWAYAWGRYLASLLVCLGLAVILLAAQLVMNTAFSLTDATYPPPDPVAGLLLWTVIALPATVLVCSLCFGLGALFPGFTAVTKLAACMAWVFLALDQDPRDLGWRVYWNPTGSGLATMLIHELGQEIQNGARSVSSAAERYQVTLHLQQQMPDVRPWIGSFLVLAGVGVLLVVLAAARFQRFRDVMV